jgi:predicted polyphosphate/ATP-dependent NAD kinase
MTVGIIANPASGKDIRRLVADASLFDNNQKVNILRRLLRAIDALGGRQVVIMPDTGELGARALEDLDLALEVRILDLPVRGDARDSAAAATRMAELGVGCIVTLGGDGTNRAVAKGSGDVPLLPVSTGTNNVFTSVVEGTVAGLAAEVVASRMVDIERVTHRAKRLEVWLDGACADSALVDVAASRELFIGSRALWQPSGLREAVLACAEPDTVGLAAVGGCLESVGRRDARALYVRFGPGGRRVLAPLAPGLVVQLEIAEYRAVDQDEVVAFEPTDGTLALDGERELEIGADQAVGVRLSLDGPRVVDVRACLAEAARCGAFER